MSNLILNRPKLSAMDRSRIDTPTELIEIEEAIDSLTIQKSRGPDGIGGEFYESFKTVISPFLLKVITHAYQVHILPPFFSKIRTVLIPKSQDPDKLHSASECKPITVCNVDYKIGTKALTNRIGTALTNIVDEHQTCEIRGRPIQTDAHIARNVLYLCDGDIRLTERNMVSSLGF